MTNQSDSPWHVPGKWFVHPAYWEEAVQKQMPFRPQQVNIKDDTLREGEETPGVVFTLEDRVEIIRRLQDLGIAEIEMPRSSSPQEQRALLHALNEFGVTTPKSYLVGGMSDWKEGVDRAVGFGADSITLLVGFPQPPGFPSRGPARSREEMLERGLAGIEYCKSQGVKVAFGTPGATRVPLEMVVDFHQQAAKAGADRVHVYDSMGIGMPASIRYLVQSVKKAVDPTPVLFHCHNDLGMATANTLAGVEGGATWVDVVINGLGDRAGNASLEEVVMGLEVYGISTNIKLEKLTELSKFIEEKAGVKLQPNKAIVGTNAFLEESSAHFLITTGAEAAGVPEAAAPYAPELIGRTHELVIGSTTLYGGAVEYKLDEWGYQYTPEQLDKVREVASKEIATKRYLTEDEFHSLCESVLR